MLFELVSVYFLLKGNLPENELDDIKGGLLLEVALDARLILPLHTGRFDEFFWIIFHFLPLGHRITKSYF